MAAFIMSSNSRHIINAAHIRRIFVQHNLKLYDHLSRMYGVGRTSGIYCDITYGDGNHGTLPLFMLQELGRYVKRAAQLQTNKAMQKLSRRFMTAYLLSVMIENLSRSLDTSRPGEVIDMRAIVEKSVDTHVRYLCLDSE